MKLNDRNSTVFEALSPEVQQQLISASLTDDIITTTFALVVIIVMLTFVYFSINLKGES